MPADDSSQFEAVEFHPVPQGEPDVSLRERLGELHADAWGWALAITQGDAQEAEEVLQITYLRILDGTACYEGRSLFRTWVFGVIRMVGTEHRRLRAGLPLGALGSDAGRAEEAICDEPGPAERLAFSQRSSRLRVALDQLSERQRQVLHLVFYQEMTIAEAAEVLGIGFGSARTHYERGKRNLRDALQMAR